MGKTKRFWIGENAVLYTRRVDKGNVIISVSVFDPSFTNNLENHIFRSDREFNKWYEEETKADLFDL